MHLIVNKHQLCHQASPTYGPRATIQPARHFYPAREVSLIHQNLRHLPLPIVNLCCRNVKNDKFVSIRYVFQALKYAKLVFCWGSAPDRAGGALGAYYAPPDSLVGWGGDTPSPFLDLGAPRLSGPPTSLKFVHLALRSKRWTPLRYMLLTIKSH